MRYGHHVYTIGGNIKKNNKKNGSTIYQIKGTIYKNEGTIYENEGIINKIGRGTIYENEGTINKIGGTIYESNDS